MDDEMITRFDYSADIGLCQCSASHLRSINQNLTAQW